MNLVVDILEKYLFNPSPETFKLILKLNTAIERYRNGLLSSSAAAELVGNLDRYEFWHECKKRGIEPQTDENTEELDAKVALLAKELP